MDERGWEFAQVSEKGVRQGQEGQYKRAGAALADDFMDESSRSIDQRRRVGRSLPNPPKRRPRRRGGRSMGRP